MILAATDVIIITELRLIQLTPPTWNGPYHNQIFIIKEHLKQHTGIKYREDVACHRQTWNT